MTSASAAATSSATTRSASRDGTASRTISYTAALPRPSPAAPPDKSTACAAQHSSTAMTRRLFSSTLRGFARRDGAHADVVFLVGRRGDGIHRRRVRQNFVFRYQCRRGVLSQHVARVEARLFRQKRRQPAQVRVDQALHPPFGNVGQLGQADAQVVQGHGYGLPVEVAAVQDDAVMGKQQRVVGDCVRLQHQPLRHVVHHVRYRSVYLGNAAQTVRILHFGRVVWLYSAAARRQAADALGDPPLAGEGAQRVDTRIKGGAVGLERFQSQRRRGVGPKQQLPGRPHRHNPDPGHDLSAVDEGQSFLRPERQGFQSCRRERLGARQQPVPDIRLAFTRQDQGHVGQRRQVPAGAQRALGRDGRMDAFVEQVYQQRYRPGLYTRMPATERIYAQEHGRPHVRHRQVGTYARGVAAQDVNLQLGRLSAGMTTVRSSPTPVVTPYTWDAVRVSSSTMPAAASMRAIASASMRTCARPCATAHTDSRSDSRRLP